MPPGIDKILLKDLNSHLRCILCGGYYIDATTIVECLHSFCKTCIVRYLETQKFCPICDAQVHKTRPLLNIRSDQTLQDIVYKLVPGLFKSEMKRRREFYAQHPEALNASVPTSSEGRGEVLGGERIIFTPEDEINISLECCPPKIMFLPRPLASQADRAQNHRRYLLCPGGLTVAHLKKLLRAKYGLPLNCPLNISYVHDYLDDKYTMMDLAYIYSWRRNGPLRLFYQILEPSWKRRKLTPSHVNVIIPVSGEAESSGSTSNLCHKGVPALPPSALARTLSPVHETRDSGINSQSSDTSSSGHSPSDDDSGELQIVLDESPEDNLAKTNGSSSSNNNSSSINTSSTAAKNNNNNNNSNNINQVNESVPQPLKGNIVPRDKLQEAMIASDLLDIQVI